MSCHFDTHPNPCKLHEYKICYFATVVLPSSSHPGTAVPGYYCSHARTPRGTKVSCAALLRLASFFVFCLSSPRCLSWLTLSSDVTSRNSYDCVFGEPDVYIGRCGCISLVYVCVIESYHVCRHIMQWQVCVARRHDSTMDAHPGTTAYIHLHNMMKKIFLIAMDDRLYSGFMPVRMRPWPRRALKHLQSYMYLTSDIGLRVGVGVLEIRPTTSYLVHLSNSPIRMLQYGIMSKRV